MTSFWKRSSDLSRRERILERMQLDAETKESLREAIKFERQKMFFVPSALLSLTAYYVGALSICSWAIGVNIIYGAVAGAVLVVVLASTFCLYPIFSPIRDGTDIRDRKSFIGMWIGLAMIIGGIGTVALVARKLLTIL